MKTFAGAQDRLFTDHARALHFLHMANSIGDDPVPVQRLNRFGTAVFNLNGIEPEIPISARVRLFGKKLRLHLHRDIPRYRCIHSRAVPILPHYNNR